MRRNRFESLMDFLQSSDKFIIITFNDYERELRIGENNLDKQFAFDLKHKIKMAIHFLSGVEFTKDPEYAMERMQQVISFIKPIISEKKFKLVPRGGEYQVTVCGKLDYIPNLLNKEFVRIINDYMDSLEMALEQLQSSYSRMQHDALTLRKKKRTFSSRTHRECIDLI